MRLGIVLAVLFVLSGCQAMEAGSTRSRSTPTDAMTQLASVLPGDFDNHEQVARESAGEAGVGRAGAVRVQHSLRLVDRGHEEITWLWRLQSEGKQRRDAIWFIRAHRAADGRHVRIVPYRAIEPAAARAQFTQPPPQPFRYDPAQWAALDACAENGEWDGAKFSAAADSTACSALLPGLGDDAALLPLRLSTDTDMIRVATFSDLSRGADAVQEARRVRWFSGWAAINGGGPRATAANQDWHMQNGLRLSSEGGRVALHWRDGASSGYSLELERTSYPERKLSVLQLNVIDDSSSKTLTYVWTDMHANAIGLNLGWLQGGFTEQVATPAGAR
jgi:hypothetical protein